MSYLSSTEVEAVNRCFRLRRCATLSLTHRTTPAALLRCRWCPFYIPIHSCRRDESWRTIQGRVSQTEELFFLVFFVMCVSDNGAG